MTQNQKTSESQEPQKTAVSFIRNTAFESPPPVKVVELWR